MTSWIDQVTRTLVYENGEVLVLGERSAEELVAHHANWLAPAAKFTGTPPKPTSFMGVPVVPSRSPNKLLIEVHARDAYTGMAKIVKLR
jgi:hypothetical protein